MRRLAGLAAMIAISMSGCSMAQGRSSCFTTRHVVLPDPLRVSARLSGGQAGRDLVAAIWSGDEEEVARRLRQDPRLATVRVEPDPALTSQPDGQYGDLLTFAVAGCDAGMVRALLDAGVPPDGGAPGSALALALLSDDPRLPELLLGRGASPDPQKIGGENLLSAVAAANHPGGAMMLIRHGLDVQWADRFGRTHLANALDLQSYAIGELLVKAGADLRRADRDGFTPAHALAREPLVGLSDGDRDARARLMAMAQADGKGWPPPKPQP